MPAQVRFLNVNRVSVQWNGVRSHPIPMQRTRIHGAAGWPYLASRQSETESQNQNYPRRPYSFASVAREQPPPCNGLYALSPGTVATIFA
jgi:hypothetical protein